MPRAVGEAVFNYVSRGPIAVEPMGRVGSAWLQDRPRNENMICS